MSWAFYPDLMDAQMTMDASRAASTAVLRALLEARRAFPMRLAQRSDTYLNAKSPGWCCETEWLACVRNAFFAVILCIAQSARLRKGGERAGFSSAARAPTRLGRSSPDACLALHLLLRRFQNRVYIFCRHPPARIRFLLRLRRVHDVRGCMREYSHVVFRLALDSIVTPSRFFQRTINEGYSVSLCRQPFMEAASFSK